MAAPAANRSSHMLSKKRMQAFPKPNTHQKHDTQTTPGEVDEWETTTHNEVWSQSKKQIAFTNRIRLETGSNTVATKEGSADNVVGAFNRRVNGRNGTQGARWVKETGEKTGGNTLRAPAGRIENE